MKYAVVIFIFALFSGCAGGINYSTLEDHIRADNCTFATEYVEKKKQEYGSNKRLLYLLDSAMVNMICGNYEKSNGYLHSAEDLAENLWTKSVSREMASFILNDYTIPYAGEDFEKAFINLISAINYAMLGEYEDALVECRRLDALLSMFNEKYGQKNIYKEDAFARYLSGIIYEAAGNLEDAFIDYYKAFQIFQDYNSDYNTPVPIILAEDMFRAAEAVDRTDDVSPYLQRVGNINLLKQKDVKKLGKIVFIHFNGKSPVKEEDRLLIPTVHGPISLAFPRYAVRRPACRKSTLSVESEDGHTEARAELVEDINSIAVKNLDDRKNRVISKTVARAAAKQAVLHAGTSEIEDRAARDMVKLLFNIVNTAVIERADIRSWRTLPGEVYLARMFLSEGQYNLYVRLCGVENQSLGSIMVKAGKTGFVFFESMY